VRRRHGLSGGVLEILVGGGALPVKKNPLRSAGGQKFVQRFLRNFNISFYPQNFLMTFFSHRKLQQNNYAATMASAARRQIIGGGAPINKSVRGRRP